MKATKSQDYEQQITEILDNIERIKRGKQQLEQTKSPSKKLNKNLERMTLELNKRFEAHFNEIIQILDSTEDAMLISTQTIMRGLEIANQDGDGIDEQIKAKLIPRFIREYRRNKEQAKLEQLKEHLQNEIQSNIQERFPLLSSQKKLAKDYTFDKSTEPFNTQKDLNLIDIEEVTVMKKGWGVSAKPSKLSKINKNTSQQSMGYLNKAKK